MPDPTMSTFLGVPGFVLLWLAATIAFALFGHRVARLVGTLRSARPENRWNHPGRRAAVVLANVFGQWRLLRESSFGVLHFVIFWAFVFFAGSFAWNLVRGLVPALPLPYADEIPWISVPMEILGALALAAIAVAALRRYVFTPAGLERTRDATLVLLLIGAVLVSFLAGQGFRSLATGDAGAGAPPVSPVGTLVASALAAAGVGTAAATTMWLAAWWLHMLVVLGFTAYLPYSKHMHLLAAPFAAFFTDLQPSAMPPPSEGAMARDEFTWRQLYNAYACAECGRCERACPAFASGAPLSPKKLIHDLKQVTLPPAAGAVTTSSSPAVLGAVVSPREVWSCTSCKACMERCPVFNEHIPLITEMRRHLVASGEIEAGLQETLVNVTRYGNSFGQSPRARARWTRGLDFEIPDARKTPVEYLWWVGDYASFDPRLQEVTRAVARVLHRAGVDFGILREGEQNAGNDVRRIGEEGLFEMLRDKNLRALEQADFAKLLTTDPHTYQALKHEYGAGDNGSSALRDKPVVHYTELLAELIDAGRLPLRDNGRPTVTYHDPCYLARYNGIVDPPRRVLEALGVRLVEMVRNGSATYCCGAGGGRIWMEDGPEVKERPAENRVREAAALPIDTLVVTCPKDYVMFQDAIKSTQLDERLVARDLIELVEAALVPEPSTEERVQ